MNEAHLADQFAPRLKKAANAEGEKVERAILHLAGGRTHACVLPADAAAFRTLMTCVRSPGTAPSETLRLRTSEGGDLSVVTDEVEGLEIPPPHCLIPDFLSPEEMDRATAHALAHAQDFADATISTQTAQGVWMPNYGIRRARIMNDVAAVLPMIISKIRLLMPKLWRPLAMEPIAFSRVECQLSVHGDGDFFNTHTDNGLPDIAHRRVTYVYYFHREPKQFTGGHLCLYNTLIEGGYNKCGALAADIMPPRNGLMVFPSYIHHEVTPIQCPSQDLADQRLTINGWLI